MAEIIFDPITLIGILVSAGAISSGIFYNARKINQNTKARYYQILKDLYERFNNIQNNQENALVYRMEMTNFGLYIKDIIDVKIIPKKYVLQPLKYVFAESLWTLKRMDKPMIDEYDTKDFFKFCEENNIKELKPAEWTLKDFKSENE